MVDDVDVGPHARLDRAPVGETVEAGVAASLLLDQQLDGQMVGVSPMEVHRMIEEGADFVLLDVRSLSEHEQVRLPGATLIPLGALRSRLDELPKHEDIVAFCKISLRGYEAALILEAAGFEKVRVMDGGIAMWPFEKLAGSQKPPNEPGKPAASAPKPRD